MRENGGGEGGRGGGKEREEKKKKRKVEDSNLCYSTDAQQNHVLRGLVLSVSHKLSLIKLNEGSQTSTVRRQHVTFHKQIPVQSDISRRRPQTHNPMTTS
jgi:hypothetical protein